MLAYNDGEPNASQTRSLPLPGLYSLTHDKLEARYDDAIWLHLALRE